MRGSEDSEDIDESLTAGPFQARAFDSITKTASDLRKAKKSDSLTG